MRIYRPFQDLDRSARCLSDRHLFKHGILQPFLLIRSICNSIVDGTDFIPQDATEKLYYNKGKPYIPELMLIIKYAQREWLKRHGAPSQYLNNVRSIVNKTKKQHTEKPTPCSKKRCKDEQKILLELDHFWYKRHFIKVEGVIREEEIEK